MGNAHGTGPQGKGRPCRGRTPTAPTAALLTSGEFLIIARELNRPEASFNEAPLENVILTTFLYVSPVQTMPPLDQMGVPIRFHSSRISGSASCMISRTFASVLPRQSPSSLNLLVD